jgi:hypothetical protein
MHIDAHRRLRPAPVALTVMLHLALLTAWQTARAPRPAIAEHWSNWLVLWPAKRPPPPASPSPPRPPAAAPRLKPPPVAALPSPPAATSEEPELSSPVAPDFADAAATPRSASPPSTQALRQRALRDIAAIDQDMRKNGPKFIRAPVSTPQSRFAAGIAAAADAVPPKWYQAARIVPVGDQGGDGPRMYKIVTAFVTYCITIGTNHGSDDSMKNGPKKSYSLCPN